MMPAEGVLNIETCEGIPLLPPTPETDDGNVGWLWWLGQAGFLIRTPHVSLAVDPYLSDSLARKYEAKEFPHARMMPFPIAPKDLTGLDYVFCSHGHTDHMDGETLSELARVNSSCRFVLPASQAALAEERGVPTDRMVLVDADSALHLDAHLALKVMPAAHEELQVNEKGEQVFLGFILRLNDLTVYHSGDCVPFDGLFEMLSKESIDVALLPVNGRDAFRRERKIMGNFTADEALELCVAAAIPIMIPHHFGMFDFNTINVQDLARSMCACAGVKGVIPRTDQAIRLMRVRDPA